LIEEDPLIIYLLIIFSPRLAKRIAKIMRTKIEKNPPVAVLNYVSPLNLRKEEYENKSKFRIKDCIFLLIFAIN
jgi:hypothetical protein